VTATRHLLDPDALAALEEERDFLLRSLEDLDREHEAGDVDESDYQALRDDYTARAAGVIRAIEARQEAIEQTQSPRDRRRTLAVVAVVLLFALGAGLLVAANSGQRRPGDEITGDIRSSSIDELARGQQCLAQAQAASSSDEAVASYQCAIAAFDQVLEIQPSNVEAMTYRGWLWHILAVQAGGASPDRVAELEGFAQEWLDKAVAADPDYAPARVFRAVVLGSLGRPADAIADVEAADPERLPSEMRPMVDGLRARLEAQVNQAERTGP
jgi:tetratricopeptide (TPR) repeat protein